MDRKPIDTEDRRPAEQILVIDDNCGIGDCIEMLLQRAGHDCVIARNGQDGLAQLRSREFDMVITDLRLPDANEYMEISKHLRIPTVARRPTY